VKRLIRASKTLRPRPGLIILACWVLLLFSILSATVIGVVNLPWKQTAMIIVNKIFSISPVGPSQYEAIIWQIRLPRVITAGMIGFTLGICGAVMQGLFRNPLASPGIVGASSGASLGAVIGIFLGWGSVSPWLLPLGAFLGSFLALVVVYILATRQGRTDVATLLLAGQAISALFSAIVALLYHFVDDGVLRQIVYWLMGDLAGKRWEHVLILSPFMIFGSLILLSFAQELNILMTGDDEARSLGVNVERTKRILLVVVSLMTGAAISISGIIGFVGLIVPHILRTLMGPDHRWLLPASALGGASLLILSDLVSRVAFAPIELRPGIVTSILGVPFLLYLLSKRREMIEWN
jgi:iron complex transport system permease protein